MGDSGLRAMRDDSPASAGEPAGGVGSAGGHGSLAMRSLPRAATSVAVSVALAFAPAGGAVPVALADGHFPDSVVAGGSVDGLPAEVGSVDETPAEGSGSINDATPSVDITEQWNAGGMRIDAPGTYVLSGDVHTDGALAISVEAGQTVVIDLAGHDVWAAGALACAIDADGCAGTLIVRDSARCADARASRRAKISCTVDLAVLSSSAGTAEHKADLPGAVGAATEVENNSSIASATQTLGELACIRCSGAATDEACAAMVRIEGVEVALDVVSGGLSAGEGLAATDAAALSFGFPDGVVESESVAAAEGAFVHAQLRDVAVSVGADVAGSLAGACGVVQHTGASLALSGAFASGSADAGFPDVRVCAQGMQVAQDFKLEGAAALRIDDAAIADGLPFAALVAELSDEGPSSNNPDESAGQALASAFSPLRDGSRSCVYREGVGFLFEKPETETLDDLGRQGGSSLAAVNASSAPAESALDGSPAEADQVSLNDLWSAQEGGASRPLVVSEAGTYRLDADLAASSGITIDAPDAAIVIDLGTSTLSFSGVLSAPCISVTQAASVRIVGAGANRASAQLVQGGSALTKLVECDEGLLAVESVSMSMRSSDDAFSLSDLGATAVYVKAGSLDMRDCSVCVDLSNQTKTNVATGGGLKNCPRGIYLGSRVQASTVQRCSVSVLGSPAAELRALEKWSTTSHVNAYGLYSLAKEAVEVAGCSFKVSSPRGWATGVQARRARLATATGAALTTVDVSAGEVAVGLRSTAQGGIDLASGLSVSYGKECAGVQAALASEVEDAFAFEAGFSGAALGVLMGDAQGEVNAAGAVIGHVDALSGSGASVAAALSDAKGAEGSCEVAADPLTGKLAFRLDEERALVEVVSSDGAARRYAGVAEAIAQLGPGDTLRLRRDVPDLAISGLSEGAYTIDLAGHCVSSLSLSGAGDVAVVSSAAGGSIEAAAGAGSAVVHSGSGSLSLTGITVSCVSSSCAVAAIDVSAGGALSLQDAVVSAHGSFGGVYGVRSTGKVGLSGCEVDVSTASVGVAAVGVRTDGEGALSCEGSSISVRAASGNAGGIDASGPVSVTATGQRGCIVEVSAGSSCEQAWGVRVRTAQAARVEDASVTVAGAQGGRSLCLASGEVNAPAKVRWELDGACSLVAATAALELVGEPVTIGNRFDLRSGSAAIDASGLEGDVCARCASIPAAESLAELFEPAAGSAYDGWALERADGAILVWGHAPVARNIDEGETYPSVARALAAARDGQTVSLLCDAAETGSVFLSSQVTLDLAGHALAWSADAASLTAADGVIAPLVLASGAGLSVVGAGDAGGRLSLSVGNASATLPASNLAGICVCDGASLELSRCALEVSYAARASATNAVSFSGVYLAGGSAVLSGAARVSAACEAARLGGEGAGSVCGVHSSSGALDVSADSAVSARNEADNPVRGEVVDSVSGAGGRGRTLMEFFPDKDGALYEELQDAFWRQASLDSATEDAECPFGANVYYAAPLTLSDGTLVWAYSDPVASEDIGARESIVATHFFAQSRYDAVSRTCGVLAEGQRGDVRVSGVVDAYSAHGDVVALSAESGSSPCVEATARIEARLGEGACPVRVLGSALDLRDELGLDSSVFPDKVFYPTGSSAERVSWENPSVEAFYADGSSAISNGGAHLVVAGAAYEVLHPFEPEASALDEVRVTFSNIVDASGRELPEEVVAVPYGQTLQQAGVTLPTPADFDGPGGVRYRFVGWSVTSARNTVNIYDAEALAGALGVDGELAGASSGAVRLQAAYVPVCADEHLVTFQVDSCVFAYGAQDGSRPAYRAGDAGAQFSIPGKLDEADGISYGFAGWCDAETGASYAGPLPAAHADVRYVARFVSAAESVSVTFRHWGVVAQQRSRTETTVSLPAGQDPVQAAAKAVEDSTAFALDGVVHVFVGWSPRASDAAPVYGLADSLPAATQSATYCAVYETRDQLIDVSYVVDGVPYAEALQVPAAATVDTAL